MPPADHLYLAASLPPFGAPDSGISAPGLTVPEAEGLDAVQRSGIMRLMLRGLLIGIAQRVRGLANDWIRVVG